MDFTALIGWLLGLAVIVFSIVLTQDASTGTAILDAGLLHAFWNLPSLLIVLGGTAAALLAAYPPKTFKLIPRHIRILFFPGLYKPTDYIALMVDFAKYARVNGILSLEEEAKDVRDKFVRSSVMLVVDAMEPEKVRTLLDTELENMEERHRTAMGIYHKAADYAIAFGMIGTLVGLVKVFAALSQPTGMVQDIGLCLVSMLYGVLLSNLVFKPMANKLQIRHDEEFLCKSIVRAGVLSIQDGDNPQFIEEKLRKLLPDKMKMPEPEEQG